MMVLDASALLAFLFREPGHDMVAEAMASACISTVNLSEALGRFARDGHDPEPLWRRLSTGTLVLLRHFPAAGSLTQIVVSHRHSRWKPGVWNGVSRVVG